MENKVDEGQIQVENNHSWEHFAVGDWVVHCWYGVGQIRRIELRTFDGKPIRCFRVDTRDSTFWFPVEENRNPRIRPVSSQQNIQKALRCLRRKTNNLDTDRKYWKEQIANVQSDGDILSISKLVRDLSVQHTIRKLNSLEERALKHFRELLMMEWAASMHLDISKLQPLLDSYILETTTKVSPV